MTLSMYQASVPVFVRALTNLAHVLRKGEAHARAKNVSDEVLLQTRLIPDMLPLVGQIRIATDMARRGAARLAGLEPESVEDNETTLPELYERIERAVQYLNTLRPEQIDGSEARPIQLKTRSGELNLDGQAYLLHYVLPNVFFHCTTAYDILRTSGVELGKTDFLGGT